MDFVEQWFGVSPDGGNGTFEASLILAATVVVGLVCLPLLIRRFLTRSGGPDRQRA